MHSSHRGTSVFSSLYVYIYLSLSFSHFSPQTKQFGKQFGQPNPHLKGPTFHEEWEMVDGEWLRMKQPDL